MRAVCVIPARMGSSRFPGKPLAPLLGLPLVLHVWHRCRLYGGFERVLVATCDDDIAGVVTAAGGEAVMTSDRHERATDDDRSAAVPVGEPAEQGTRGNGRDGEHGGVETECELATVEWALDEQRDERHQRADVHEERKCAQRDDDERAGDQSVVGRDVGIGARRSGHTHILSRNGPERDLDDRFGRKSHRCDLENGS